MCCSAAEVLERYGINERINRIRDSQADVEAATLLMRKLTRRANQRSLGEWTQLQSDMADLQNKVYRCITGQACSEVTF